MLAHVSLSRVWSVLLFLRLVAVSPPHSYSLLFSLSDERCNRIAAVSAGASRVEMTIAGE